MKKFIICFIVIALGLSMVVAYLQFRRVEFDFEEVSGGYALSKYMSRASDVEDGKLHLDIPDYVDGDTSKPITTLSDFSLANDENLTSIHIGKLVTSISPWAFTNIRNLEKFTVSEENPNYTAVDGVLYTKDLTTIVSYPNSRGVAKNVSGLQLVIEAYSSYVMPDSVTKIGEQAFYKCSYLEKIEFSPNLKTIGARLPKLLQGQSFQIGYSD